MLLKINVTVPTLGIKFDPTFPNVRDTVTKLGFAIQHEWIKVAESRVNRATGEYINQLKSFAAVRLENNGFGVIVTNYAKHAKIIENGHQAFRLPEEVQWGKTAKTKWTKKGKPYLIIPFKHFVPSKEAGGTQGATVRHIRQMMPQEIYDYAKRLTPSVNIGGKTKWGGRLTSETTNKAGIPAAHFMYFSPAGVPIHGSNLGFSQKHEADRIYPISGKRAHWKFSRFHGMVKVGAADHAKYLTFRVLTPLSPGWLIPAQPGLHVAEQTKNNMEPIIKQALQKAFAKDIQNGIVVGKR